jgi:hypothetical protein
MQAPEDKSLFLLYLKHNPERTQNPASSDGRIGSTPISGISSQSLRGRRVKIIFKKSATTLLMGDSLLFPHILPDSEGRWLCTTRFNEVFSVVMDKWCDVALLNVSKPLTKRALKLGNDVTLRYWHSVDDGFLETTDSNWMEFALGTVRASGLIARGSLVTAPERTFLDFRLWKSTQPGKIPSEFSLKKSMSCPLEPNKT